MTHSSMSSEFFCWLSRLSTSSLQQAPYAYWLSHLGSPRSPSRTQMIISPGTLLSFSINITSYMLIIRPINCSWDLQNVYFMFHIFCFTQMKNEWNWFHANALVNEKLPIKTDWQNLLWSRKMIDKLFITQLILS